MAFRGGGRGGRKNRPSPYNMKDGKPVSWQDRSGINKDQQELQPGERLPPNPATEGAEQSVVPTDGPQIPEDNSANLFHPPPAIKKFTNKARLFFGNLPRDFSEEELRGMLSQHGEIQEIYHNKEKNFAFARMVRVVVFIVTMTSF